MSKNDINEILLKEITKYSDEFTAMYLTYGVLTREQVLNTLKCSEEVFTHLIKDELLEVYEEDIFVLEIDSKLDYKTIIEVRKDYKPKKIEYPREIQQLKDLDNPYSEIMFDCIEAYMISDVIGEDEIDDAFYNLHTGAQQSKPLNYLLDNYFKDIKFYGGIEEKQLHIEAVKAFYNNVGQYKLFGSSYNTINNINDDDYDSLEELYDLVAIKKDIFLMEYANLEDPGISDGPFRELPLEHLLEQFNNIEPLDVIKHLSDIIPLIDELSISKDKFIEDLNKYNEDHDETVMLISPIQLNTMIDCLQKLYTDNGKNEYDELDKEYFINEFNINEEIKLIIQSEEGIMIHILDVIRVVSYELNELLEGKIPYITLANKTIYNTTIL